MEEKEDVPVDKIGDNKIDDLKAEGFEVLNIEVWYIWFSQTFIAYWLSTLSLQPKENISEKKESEEKASHNTLDFKIGMTFNEKLHTLG